MTHQTQIEGLRAVAPKRQSIRERVFGLFQQNPAGLTDWELFKLYQAQWGGIERSIQARRCELVEDHELREAGVKRNPNSGVNNIVWQVGGDRQS